MRCLQAYSAVTVTYPGSGPGQRTGMHLLSLFMLLGLLSACAGEKTQTDEAARPSAPPPPAASHDPNVNPYAKQNEASKQAERKLAADNQVRAVMAQLRSQLEATSYGGDSGCPADLNELVSRVKALNLTFNIQNPFSKQVWDLEHPSGQGIAEMYQPGYCRPGLVLYEVLQKSEAGHAVDYAIHGCDSEAKPLEPPLKRKG